MCVKTARLWESREQGGASREGKAVCVSKQRGYGRVESRAGHPGKARQMCVKTASLRERVGRGIQGRQGSMCVNMSGEVELSPNGCNSPASISPATHEIEVSRRQYEELSVAQSDRHLRSVGRKVGRAGSMVQLLLTHHSLQSVEYITVLRIHAVHIHT